MNLHTIYFSPTKTTEKVVKAICKGMGMDPNNHDITLPSNRRGTLELGKDDCLIVGMPVYSGRIPQITEEFLSNVKGNNTPAVLVAVYGNRDYDDALLEMKDMFNKQGFISLAAAAFIGQHSFTDKVASGRPDADDLLKGENFGSKVKELIDGGALESLSLNVKGNRPYKERKAAQPVGPSVIDNCTKCGTCVKVCPSGALELDGIIKVTEEKCIKCNACVRSCPEGAITFGDKLSGPANWLEENCSDRKEPEIIYGV